VSGTVISLMRLKGRATVSLPRDKDSHLVTPQAYLKLKS